MKKLFTFGAFVCLVAFSACGDDKQADVPVVSNDVVEKDVVTSSFTFRVHASFPGLSEDEQLYGKFGVFYIEKGADTESLFEKWRTSGSAGKLKKKVAVVQESAGVISLVVDGLIPNTEYHVCPFFQADDKRILGKVSVVKTNAFGSTITNSGITSNKFFSADTKCTVNNLDSLDSKYCYYGVQYTTGDQDVAKGQRVELQGNPKSGTYQLVIPSLNANTEYKFRPYLAVKSQDTIFGETKVFSTRNYDEVAVDMGTSVLWSPYFLGAESEEESGEPYRFGQTEPVKVGGQYSFIDRDGYFTDACPENISGTEYDAATKKLGEGWRIPTTAEIQELLDNLSSIMPLGTGDRTKSKLKLNSKNGNSITLPQTDYCYAYTRKVNRYPQQGYMYFFAADMEVGETYDRISYHYNMTDEMFNTLLDEELEKYLEEHPSATTIYLKDLLGPYIENGTVWFDTVQFTYRYYSIYRPNNDMYYIGAGGTFDGGSLIDGKWDFRKYIRSYADYGYCILPVRDKGVRKDD